MRIPGTGRLRRTIRRFKSSNKPGGIILLYHRIAKASSDPWGLCVSPGHFSEHLEVLRKHYSIVSLQQLIEALKAGDIRRRWVALTFDDGYADNLYNAKPLLEFFEVPATFFLTTGSIGKEKEFWWDELEGIILQSGKLPDSLRLQLGDCTVSWELGEATQLSEYDFHQHRVWKAWESPPSPRHALYYFLWRNLQKLPETQQRKTLDELWLWAGRRSTNRQSHRPLLKEEVVALAQGDLCEIGAHTVTHPVLSALPSAAQQLEIWQSKAQLEEILGGTITKFAYPHGRSTEKTAALIRDARFTCACSTVEDMVRKNTNCFQFPRIQVEDTDGDEFDRKVSRYFHL